MDGILYLRRYYQFGPSKIQMYLTRYHSLHLSKASIWRVPQRAGVNRLPTSMRYRRRELRYKRYEKPLPGHQLQVDVKFLAPLNGSERRRYYQYMAIDDCTRVRVLKIFERNTQITAIAFVDEARQAPLPSGLHSDR